MTKETRIGLLVGLLFIVAFGLVLSELAGTDSSPPAPAAAEENFESYAHTPVIEEAFPFAERVAAGRRSPGPSDGQPAAGGGVAAVEVSLSDPLAEGDRGGGMIEAIEAEVSPGPAVLAATDRRTPPIPPAPAPTPAPAPPPRRRVYTVQPNDTLIRIARRLYGPGNDMLYKRIYKANRDVLVDESTLEIGQELVIPPLGPGANRPGGPGASASTPLGPAAPPPLAGGAGQREGTGYAEMDVSDLRRHFAGVRSLGPVRRAYVVRRGDNLTGIARKLLNDDSPAAVRRIFNANRDTLASPDLLQVGMKLNIPS